MSYSGNGGRLYLSRARKVTEMCRYVVIIVALLVTFLPDWSLADRTTMTRQEIRTLRITERPSRPGHFYGNTVRRLNERRSGR